MINFQKSYSVHFGPIRSILSSSVHLGSIWSKLVLIGPNWYYSILFSLLQFTLVIFNPLWFYSVHIGPIRSILSALVDICPIRSTMILFDPYVHLDPNLSIGSYLVHLFPFCHILSIRSTQFHLVHLCPLRSIFIHLHIRKNICLG